MGSLRTTSKHNYIQLFSYYNFGTIYLPKSTLCSSRVCRISHTDGASDGKAPEPLHFGTLGWTGKQNSSEVR